MKTLSMSRRNFQLNKPELKTLQKPSNIILASFFFFSFDCNIQLQGTNDDKVKTKYQEKKKELKRYRKRWLEG